MSDDRFKQARRSLIDRNKQRQQEQDDGASDDFHDDDFHEDEKTLMVNVDELQGSPQSSGGQPPPQPPQGQSRRNSGGRGAGQGGGSGRQDDFADAATQMVDIHDLDGAPPGPQHVEESTEPHREAFSPGPSAPSSPPPATGGQQVFAPGGDSGHEGKTDFINISDFAQQGNEFAPDSNSAGYEGKTAFIQIDALQGAQQQPSAPPQQAQGTIANDQMLRQAYQFGPESIQQGEVTLIFAQNPLGRQVVLRRVWEGNHAQMPPDVRQRVAQLDTLEHPRLVKLNGVVATQSGLWADLQKPEGYRLSAVLQQHGPQDKENVIIWLKQIAEVLDEIHASELLYANLTPDAVWIQEDNSIMLEPFDLLSFEKRGDLGEFGAQELKRPPSDRVLSPATDIFSLASIGAAAVTGLPFHAEKLANLEDQKFAKKLQKGLKPNPAERPQKATELTDQFKVGGFSLDQLSLDPAELDIKVVAAIAVVLLGGFAGYMYWDAQQAQKAAQQRAQQAAIAQQQAPPGQEEGGSAATGAPGEEAGTPDGADGEAGGAGAIAPPGAVEADARLNIVSSYQKNPPVEDTEAELSGEEATAEARKLRAAARKRISEAKDLRSDEVRRDEYTAALEDVTTAIRLNGGQPTDDDQQILDDLTSERLVREYRDDLRERIDEAIAKGAVSDARRSYKRLYTIDHRAKAVDFFNRHNEANVRTVHAAEESAEDKDN
jgi:hypothetical protein